MRAPNIGSLQKVLCAFGWHRRRHRQFAGETTLSCMGCGRYLRKTNRGWRTLAKTSDHAH